MKRALVGRAVAALLGAAGALALLSLSAGVPLPAQAQEHEEGGGCGSGGGCGGGHEGGSSGMGSSGGHGQGAGAEHGMHGTRPGHEGHVSGVHEAGSETDRAASAHGASDRRFGGGSGLATLDAVPEGPGGFGQGAAKSLRYWGGWTIPVDENAAAVVLEQAPLGSGGGGSGPGLSLSAADRCEDVGGRVSAAQRIAGRNLARINSVHSMIVPPGVRPETVAPFLLANFQEELEKSQPDTLLAGVYLGTVAARPVTPQLVRSAGAALCVAVDAQRAASIAAAAEAQRVGKSKVELGPSAKAKP